MLQTFSTSKAVFDRGTSLELQLKYVQKYLTTSRFKQETHEIAFKREFNFHARELSDSLLSHIASSINLVTTSRRGYFHIGPYRLCSDSGSSILAKIRELL